MESKDGQIKRKLLYAQAVFGEEEKKAVYDSMDNGWLASGPLVTCFEQEIAKLFGKKYGIAVNSGSSANLLTLAALKLPRGSEVITPACTFSTTVSTILFNNLTTVFVDVVIGRYTINEDSVEKAITKNTRVILVPQLVGGVCDMVKLREIADRHNLVLIDDSCDTLAPYLNGAPAAALSDVTTTSFYGSHIITALGFGGMILTDNVKLKDTLITLRDWGRVGNDKEEFNKRFDFTIDSIPYDSKFLYSELGFNLKMNEAAAAFGLVQLQRLPVFLARRSENFSKIKKYFVDRGLEKWFYLPYLIDGAITNWLAFPLTIKETAPFTRYELLKHLEEKGIQTRVLFSGNITRHPVYKRVIYKTSGLLENADKIMASGLLLGCHQAMTDEDIHYLTQSLDEFFNKY